jgi:hypothetical protein
VKPHCRPPAGLRLSATDADWSTGTGQEVTGPLLSIILAMSGRRQACPDLAGEDVTPWPPADRASDVNAAALGPNDQQLREQMDEIGGIPLPGLRA